MPLAGWTYHRPLTDANSTALSDFVTRVDLTSSNFDFTKAKADGSDLRVRDETAGALVPHWLADYDATARTALLYYRATATGHAHALYYGNAAASSASAFLTANSGVMDHGSGFDSDFGDLSSATAANGYAVRVPASSGASDPRNFEVWSFAEPPTLQYSVTGFFDGLYTGVREFSLVRDAVTGLPVTLGGKYYATFARRSAAVTDKLDSAICSGTSQYGPFSGFSVFYDAPGTIRLCYPSTVIKVGSTYICYLTYGWDTGGATTPGLTVYVLTSTDLVTWSAASSVLAPSIWTDPISSDPCTDAGNPWVIRCADGTYFMTVEAHGSSGRFQCFGATASDPIAGPWTAVNSGGYLVRGTGSTAFDNYGTANPKVLQLPDASYVMQYNGAVDATNGDFQHGFATATARGGPWTKAAYNPVAGRSSPSYGIETSSLHYDVDGTSLLNFGQRFGDSGTGSSAAKIYRMRAQLKRGGLLVSPAPADAAFVGRVVAAGSLVAESRSVLTAHRTGGSTPIILGLWDYASPPAAAAGATFNAADNVTIFRWSHDFAPASNAGPGDITFYYVATDGTRNFWNGSAWTSAFPYTGRNLPADHGREVVARIADDGTNYVLTAVYGDDGSAIPGGSATVAKAAVRAYSAGRCLIAGDMQTDGWNAGLFLRHLLVRPYAAIEPAIAVGSPVQDQATTFTLTPPSPATGTVGVASGNFTVTPDANYAGTLTLTPSGGGLSTPQIRTINTAAPQTYTITPTIPGVVTLTLTNSSGLANPAPVTYTATPAVTVATTTVAAAITTAFAASRAGAMGLTVYDLSGAVVTARTTAGIAFIGNAFVAAAVVPWTGSYVIDWDDGTTHDAMLIAEQYVEPAVTAPLAVLTHGQAQAAILAATTGKTSDGGLTFYAPNGTTVRLAGAVAGSDRSSSTLTLPT